MSRRDGETDARGGGRRTDTEKSHGSAIQTGEASSMLFRRTRAFHAPSARARVFFPLGKKKGRYLFSPRVGLIVTNLARPAERIVGFYDLPRPWAHDIPNFTSA